MIRYTPQQARQILEKAQTFRCKNNAGAPGYLPNPEAGIAVDSALDLLKGLLDDSILVRELPPAAVRPDIILTRDEISAGRYRNAKEAQK